MFSRKDQLLRKTGPDGIGRFDFLRLLKKEFQETISEESKKQILANLANFSYDPINYDYIRSLKILDLFLEELGSNDEVFVNYAAAAVCNLSSDPTNRDYIISKNGVELISGLLYRRDEDIILNAITTLMFLKTDESMHDISHPKIINRVQNIKRSNNPRLFNLATIFLEDTKKDNNSNQDE